MKFNEKLIELRKKEGLSQEELGYKLNVTRQTVSKWELGQTTPEMDKLIEISKVFNTSVDELINESEITSDQSPIIEDQPIEQGKEKKNKTLIIVVGALIVVIALIIIKMFTAMSAVNTVNNLIGGAENQSSSVQGIFDRIFNLFDKALEQQENMLNSKDDLNENAQNMMGNIEEMFENTSNKIEQTAINSTLELFKGSQNYTSLKKVLDEVITINKTKERKIAVEYLETKVQDPEEIKNLKNSFNDTHEFEISYEYDEEGYIYEVLIEKSISEFEVKRFNNSFEIFAGTKMGGVIINTLDSIITSNKKEERKITVKYLETETQDEAEIKNIKRKIDTFTNYELTYEYDADGFINKATIEKF